MKIHWSIWGLRFVYMYSSTSPFCMRHLWSSWRHIVPISKWYEKRWHWLACKRNLMDRKCCHRIYTVSTRASFFENLFGEWPKIIERKTLVFNENKKLTLHFDSIVEKIYEPRNCFTFYPLKSPRKVQIQLLSNKVNL